LTILQKKSEIRDNFGLNFASGQEMVLQINDVTIGCEGLVVLLNL